MAKKGRMSRRSFLTRVAGAALGGGALSALGVVSGAAAQQRTYTGITDSDRGPNMDQGGSGRGGQPSGRTDNDTGATGDPIGRGRGTPQRSGYTDRDTGTGSDPVGNGRGPGCTDSDSGSASDPVSYGRRCRRS